MKTNRTRKLRESDFQALNIKPTDKDYDDAKCLFDFLLITGVRTSKP